MKEKIRSTIKHITTVGLLFIFLLGASRCAILLPNHYSDMDTEIYEWVKARMKVTEDYPRPEVKRVTQKELGQIANRNISKETYDRWIIELGEKEAAEHRQNMINGIRGAFVPENVTLYIANDVGTLVYRKGTIAHEYTHYLQQKSLGVVNLNSDPEGWEYFRREMEGAKIGEEYVKHICPKCDERGVIKEE